MSVVTPITVLATPTQVQTGGAQASTPPHLENASNETITLTFTVSGDTYDLLPGLMMRVRPQMDITATSASGTALLNVLVGIVPVGAGGVLSATFDESTGSLKVQRVDPEWSHTSGIQESASDLADGTYEVYVDMEGFKHCTAGILSTNGTAGANVWRVYTSPQNDETAQDAVGRRYYDVTNTWFGSPTFTSAQLATTPLERTVPTATKYIKLEMTRTGDGGNNDGAYTADVQLI
jgi:hypothetical protein